MIKGRFLLHYSDRRNWRLRNIEVHPLDPGWEVGKYCKCHEDIRVKVELGTHIFDVVVDDGNPVIRSAFIISDAKGEGSSRVLYFNEFYFADAEPIRLPGRYIQYRIMKFDTWVRKYGSRAVWDEVIEQYTHYKIGQRPSSIDRDSWKRMVEKSSRIREEISYC